MSAPSPELAWIGIIGGIIGILSALVNLTIIWRNRRRLEFRVVSATVYAQPWHGYEAERSRMHGLTKMAIKSGDIRRAFIVAEFAIKNNYPTEISIGRFMIDRWMFSDRFHRSGIVYPLKHDYRIFDLYTGAAVNLERYARIPSRGVYGLRLEVLEDTNGPEYGSNHSRYVVKLPRKYAIEFLSDTRKYKYTLKLTNVVTHEYQSLDDVHHWSDLLPEETLDASERARPQGLEIPEHRLPWRIRLQGWFYEIKNRVLYGTPYHWSEQVSRISRLRSTLKKHVHKDSSQK